jgi:hypothetical protein
MNKHGYFYNKTLDDFVKDLNWHAGELFSFSVYRDLL